MKQYTLGSRPRCLPVVVRRSNYVALGDVFEDSQLYNSTLRIQPNVYGLGEHILAACRRENHAPRFCNFKHQVDILSGKGPLLGDYSLVCKRRGSERMALIELRMTNQIMIIRMQQRISNLGENSLHLRG